MKQKIENYSALTFLLILLMNGCSLIDTIKGELIASKKSDSVGNNEANQKSTQSNTSKADQVNSHKSEILQNNVRTSKREVITKNSTEEKLVLTKLKDEQSAVIKAESQLPVYGYVENVLLGPGDLHLKAKLDSGAKTSSLNTSDLVEFERDGEQWVKFKLIDPSAEEEEVEFERKIERHVRIKQHCNGIERRPVIMMEVQLGTIHVEREFTLSERSESIYQASLGRNILNGLVLIDTSRTFVQTLVQSKKQ